MSDCPCNRSVTRVLFLKQIYFPYCLSYERSRESWVYLIIFTETVIGFHFSLRLIVIAVWPPMTTPHCVARSKWKAIIFTHVRIDSVAKENKRIRNLSRFTIKQENKYRILTRMKLENCRIAERKIKSPNAILKLYTERYHCHCAIKA